MITGRSLLSNDVGPAYTDRLTRGLSICAVIAICLTGSRSSAQTSEVSSFYGRINALYEHGDTEGQRHVLDSMAALPVRTGDASNLARVFRARLRRNRGEARAALTGLDSVLLDTSGAHPLVRYSCMDERARVLKQLGRYPRADIEADEALRIARTERLARQEISALVLKAEIARRLGLKDSALALLVEAEALEGRVGYPLARCNLLINRGNLLYKQERTAEALARYREARECGLAGGFRQLVMLAIFNEGSALSQMHEDSIGPAIAIYERALADDFVKQDRRHQADLLGAIGVLRNTQGRFDLSLAAIERSLDIRRELNDTMSQAQELITLASIQSSTGHVEEGLEAAMQGLVLSRASRALDEERSALKEISGDLAALGRHEEANQYLAEFIAVNDSLEERASDELTLDMEYKYQLEKKEGMLAMSQARTRRRELQLLGSAIIAVLLIVMLSLVVRNIQHLRKGQAQTRLLHEQQVNDLLKQQEIRSFDAMMLGQEKERSRVARDLHDRIGTMLSTVRLRFSALQGRIEDLGSRMDRQEDQAFKLLDEAVVEVRRISHDMVRGNLSRFGLTVALEDLCGTLRVPGSMEVELGVHGLEQRLEGKIEVAVYRMVQEAVGNVLKHAQASELSIQVNRAPASLNVMVEDNGAGFDPTQQKEGMGMGNLRERASAFGGAVTVDSRTGHGTTVTIDIPLQPQAGT